VSPNETGAAPEERGAPARPGAQAAAARGEATGPLSRARFWVALAGLLAGVVAFGVGEMIHELIPAQKVEVHVPGRVVMAPSVETTNVADARNGALTFGVLGLCLAGFLGIAGGVAQRSASATVGAGLSGSILGLVGGAGVSGALLPFFFKMQPAYQEYELLLSMIMHGSIWGLTGAAAGLAFALGLGETRLCGRALAAGFLGALLGTVAFELIGAMLFPFANTGWPISTTWTTRLIARLLVCVATAAGVILLLPRPGAPTASPT
jgi:hypothetical protein